MRKHFIRLTMGRLAIQLGPLRNQLWGFYHYGLHQESWCFFLGPIGSVAWWADFKGISLRVGPFA